MPLAKPSDVGLRGDQLADELVVRLVVEQRLVQPGGDLLAAAVDVAGAGVVVAQQVVPERQPVVGVGDAVVEQAADQRASLVRVGVGDERFDGRRRRQQADEIEASAADERRVVGQRRRRDAVLAPVGEHDAVDRVVDARLRRRQLRPARLQRGGS